MSKSYAQLNRKGWALADHKERNRRKLRPETYRGAFADLCIAIDNSRNKEADYNPRYWGMRWEWNDNEVKRFIDLLVKSDVFEKRKKKVGRGYKIGAPKAGCKQFVSKKCQVCNHKFQQWQWKDGQNVSNICQECIENVSKVPPTQLINKDIYKAIFDHWNSKQIIQHKDPSKFTSSISVKLKAYGFDLVIESIDNYATVVHGKEYFFSHRWTLGDFLKRENGFEKFLSQNKPFENYKSTPIRKGKRVTGKEAGDEVDRLIDMGAV